MKPVFLFILFSIGIHFSSHGQWLGAGTSKLYVIDKFVGVSTSNPQMPFHVGGNVLFFDNSTTSVPFDEEKTLGNYFTWEKTSGALRIVRRTSRVTTFWDEEVVGESSIAMGVDARARGYSSICIGNKSLARSPYSICIGVNAYAEHENSIAIGNGVKTFSVFETAQGCYNTSYVTESGGGLYWRAKDRLFTIGNGQGETTRSDALTILKNGDMKIGNKGTYFTNLKEGQMAVGNSSTQRKTVFIDIPTPFTNIADARIVITPQNEVPAYPDVFVTTLRKIENVGTGARATIEIYRVDGTSWGQNLRLNWMAWE